MQKKHAKKAKKRQKCLKNKKMKIKQNYFFVRKFFAEKITKKRHFCRFFMIFFNFALILFFIFLSQLQFLFKP